MASAQLPVATIAKTGYYDTIINGKTGVLCSNLAKLQKSIIELLNSNDTTDCIGKNAKLYIAKFSPDIIVNEWIALFESIYSDTLNIRYSSPVKPFNSQFKWLRMCNRFLRFRIGVSFIPSILKLESFAYKVLSRKI